MIRQSRRDFLQQLGISTAVMPFALNLTSLVHASTPAKKRQRLVVIFSPNGTIPEHFWPASAGKLNELPRILKPLEPFKDQLLTLHGVADRVRGDGDSHMRGIGCLLTGAELFPGNIQGGSDTPAGWASGLSIDQEIKNHLQKDPATRTRFGSLEFGVLVPERADTWTRMSYLGANKPITPISDPYQMFQKLYGQKKDQESLASVLDDITADLKKLSSAVSADDRRLLEEHTQYVREVEQELKSQVNGTDHPEPKLEPGIKLDNDNMPKLSKLQIDLMVTSFAADFARVATLQYTNSVGQARMKWLGINENHHQLSHEPDSNKPVYENLTKINTWFCEQLAYLAKRLHDTPEPGGQGTMLEHTTIVWTNELGKGNSHTLNDIPFVLVGKGLNFKMGEAKKFKQVAHHRLLLSIAHGFGHHLKAFGNPDYCGEGPLSLT